MTQVQGVLRQVDGGRTPREHPRWHPKAPSVDVYLDWVKAAWDSLPEALIASSFKACGITTAVDGSEDDEIHCFKEHGPIPGGLEDLRASRMLDEIENLELRDDEFVDQEQDSENEYLSDASIEL